LETLNLELGNTKKPNYKKTQLSLLIVNERVYPLYIGGMELATYHLVNALMNQDQIVKVLTAKEYRTSAISLPEFINITYTTRIKAIKFLIFLIFGFFKIFKESKNIDLLHGQPIFPSGLLVTIAGKILRKPTILWARGADIYEHLENSITRPFVKWTITGATHIIALTEDLKKRIQKYCKDKQVSIVPNGVSLPKRMSFDRKEFFRKYEYLMSFEQKKIILFVGRLTSFKGLHYLLTAMPEIIRKNPDVVLLIIGAGKEQSRLIKIGQEQGIDNHVVFMGQLPWSEVLKWLRVSNLFVYPTLRGQGMNNAVLEAMASGLPVIATNVGGLPSIITHRENGILVSPKRPESLVKEVLWVISNLQESNKMGINAKKYVERFHSWEGISKMYLALCIAAYKEFYS